MSNKNIVSTVLAILTLVALFLIKEGKITVGNNILSYLTLIIIIGFFITLSKKTPTLTEEQKQEISNANKKYPFITLYPISEDIVQTNQDVKYYGNDFFFISSGILFAIGSFVYWFVTIFNGGGVISWFLALAIPFFLFIVLFFLLFVIQKCLNFLVFTNRVTKKFTAIPVTMTANAHNELRNDLLNNIAYYKKIVIIDLAIAGLVIISGLGIIIFS